LAQHRLGGIANDVAGDAGSGYGSNDEDVDPMTGREVPDRDSRVSLHEVDARRGNVRAERGEHGLQLFLAYLLALTGQEAPGLSVRQSRAR